MNETVITAVVPVSPIKSHPDTAILTETLDSIRRQLPAAEIVLTFDGVRAEQADRRPDYEEHIRRALWLADHHYGNIVPFVWNEHLHQVGMLRRVLDLIETPLLLFVEQDTPLTDDLIDWSACIKMLDSGEANMVRFSHEAAIHPEHAHMMHGLEGQFMRTSQFSARPHLASVAYYRRMLASHFTPDAKCFTEDVMHGIVDEAFNLDGMAGWAQHRIWVFHPDTGNIKRSYHTDGRAGEAKYDTSQVF